MNDYEFEKLQIALLINNIKCIIEIMIFQNKNLMKHIKI